MAHEPAARHELATLSRPFSTQDGLSHRVRPRAGFASAQGFVIDNSPGTTCGGPPPPTPPHPQAFPGQHPYKKKPSPYTRLAVVPRPSGVAGPQRARTGPSTLVDLGRICAPK